MSRGYRVPVTDTPSATGGLRALARASVRTAIADRALQLFDEQGYDETTVDDIAAAMGISGRTFFRYFATKEDVVIGDLIIGGAALRDRVAALIVEQAPWHALHGAMREGAEEIDANPVRWRRTMRVINSTASLRARNIEKHLTSSALLTPVMSGHVAPDPRLGDLPARVVVSSAFACLDSALTSWTTADGSVSLVDTLDIAFAARLDQTAAR
jgi:AcrR family transcriptional regulator